MRKHILYLVVAMYSNLAFCQKIHFTDPGNNWNVLHENYGPPTTYNSVSCYHSGDTTLHSVLYQRITTNGTGEPFLLVREDTILSKVFILVNDTERIYMDYTLLPGDTITHINEVNDTFRHYVHDTTSVIINSLRYRVWTFLSAAPGDALPYTVIEGIGCLNGPAFIQYPRFDFDQFNLICFTTAGTTPPVSPTLNEGYGYYFDNASSCSLSVPTMNSNEVSHLYPNPAFDVVTVSVSEPIPDMKIEISDITGKVIMSRTMDAPLTEINISGLPNGSYLCSFKRKNGEQKVEKLVVMHQ
jgi:Secretion system C-terminal sorting domain